MYKQNSHVQKDGIDDQKEVSSHPTLDNMHTYMHKRLKAMLNQLNNNLDWKKFVKSISIQFWPVIPG